MNDHDKVAPPGPTQKRTFDDIHGCMRGLITVAPGVDLTEPAVDPEDWNAERGDFAPSKA